jgi:murein DD-endopeptidase MepM/ murein hydrolase activator NlpD
MTRRRSGSSRIVAAASGGFLAGAIVALVTVWHFPNVMRSPNGTGQDQAEPPAADRTCCPVVGDDGDAERGFESRPSPPARPPPVAKPLLPSSTNTTIFEADPLSELRDRQLEIPLQGAARRELRDSFDETRGSTHRHEAIDIMAPRHTPILAVEDGTIARLFQSKPGGTTIYQFDPTTRYVYYYAHLERYADGLQEGRHVQRGQVLGYVGTSGNASNGTPHLHFAIFRLTEKKRWWQGNPIDPYQVMKDRSAR